MSSIKIVSAKQCKIYVQVRNEANIEVNHFQANMDVIFNTFRVCYKEFYMFYDVDHKTLYSMMNKSNREEK